ncbi:MAG TPA: hypothetical protein VIR58_11075, partial [Acidimicrobiales bacterium]
RFPVAAEGDHRWVEALAQLVDSGRLRQLELRTIDGTAVNEVDAELHAALEQSGFQQAYKGWTRRPTKR